MKKTITLLTILLSLLAFSQEFQFEEVVKVDSINKDELFNRARTWIGKTYNNEKYVIATEDRANGELSGNGILNYNPGRIFFGVDAVRGEVDYKINIYVKDGRYKYSFHSFRHTGSYTNGSKPISYGLITVSNEAPKPSRGGAGAKAWSDIKDQTEKNIKKTIEGLKEAMNKQYESSKDW